MKMCSICRQPKSLENYHKNSGKRDGYDTRCKSCMKTYYISRRTEKLTYQKQYDKRNRKRIHTRRMKNPDYRIADSIRRRLRNVLKNNWDSSKYIDYLGCSIPELRKHLEDRFEDGMNWENYGEWHIDHIRALSLFDFSKEEDLQTACHYTNLQPLWAMDNITKSNKII